MAVRPRGRAAAKEQPKQIANKRATPHEVNRWRKAWGLGPDVQHIGGIDPMPMPPGTPCKPCLGGSRYWIEAEAPHQGWRCVTCHPAPAGMVVRLYEIDEEAEAAERDRIEAAAKPAPPPPKEPVTTQDNWWE